MAKAADIDVDPFEPFAQAAARSVRVRAAEVFEHADGVLDTSDIERVHAMRVATRRLRAVLEVFAPCFDRAQLKGALHDVKLLADALGERRDPDVHVEAMEAFAAAVAPAQRSGVQTYVARLREHQAAANVVLAAALQDVTADDLAGRLQALADSAEPTEPEPADATEPDAAEGTAAAPADAPAPAPDQEPVA